MEQTPTSVSRFRVLAAGLILELCGGSIYIVSLYLHDLEGLWFKDDPNALEKLQSLTLAAALGNWIPIGGFFYDSRFGGPRNTVLVASVLTLVGYGGLALFSSLHLRDDIGLWVLRLLWFLWGHGSGYFDLACMTTTAKNFSGNMRGSAVGVVKALYGLSGALLTQPYLCFFNSKGPDGALHFLIFLAISLSSLGMLSAPFMHVHTFTPAMMIADQPMRRLRAAAIIILALALLLTVGGLLRRILSFRPGSAAELAISYSSLAVAIVGVLALMSVARHSHVRHDGVVGGADTPPEGRSPLLPAADETVTATVACGPINVESAETRLGMEVPALPPAEDVVESASSASAPASLTNGSVWQNLSTANYWLLFVAFFAGTGGGLVLTNHIAFIVLAQFGPGAESDAAAVSNSCISLFSVFNAVGRLGAGLGSDSFRHVISRPTLFSAAVALMGLSHATLIFARITALIYVAIVGAGFAYGALWALLPTLIGELFGLRAFASTYMVYSLAVSGGSLVLSTLIASKIAEAHTHAPPSAPPPTASAPPHPLQLVPPTKSPPLALGATNVCYGDGCYRDTHLIVVGLCIVGALSVALVSIRTRHFYRRLR